MSRPPTTGVGDLARLGCALGHAALRNLRDFNAESVFRQWARRVSRRLHSNDLVVNFLLKKAALVGSPELSWHSLAEPPRHGGLTAGSLKRSGMAFLAAHALTISDDENWRRRAFNEVVLEPDRRHEFATAFVRVAPYAFWKQRRLYEALRSLWQAQSAALNASLLCMAGRCAATLDHTELLRRWVRNRVWHSCHVGMSTAPGTCAGGPGSDSRVADAVSAFRDRCLVLSMNTERCSVQCQSFGFLPNRWQVR